MLDEVRVALASALGQNLVVRVLLTLEELHVGRRVGHVLDAPHEPERAPAAREDVHAAVVGALEHLGHARRAAHLAQPTLGQPHDSELRLLFDAAPDHELVALLEDVQGHDLGRQEDQPQGEQRKALCELSHLPGGGEGGLG